MKVKQRPSRNLYSFCLSLAVLSVTAVTSTGAAAPPKH